MNPIILYVFYIVFILYFIVFYALFNDFNAAIQKLIMSIIRYKVPRYEKLFAFCNLMSEFVIS